MAKGTIEKDVKLDTDQLDSLVDTMQQLAESATNAKMVMESLCEILKVDPDELKEKMVIKALENLGNGEESGYIGDLNADSLWLIKRLQVERDRKEKNVEKLAIERTKYQYNIDRVINMLCCAAPMYKVPIKTKYSIEDVEDTVEQVLREYKYIHDKVLKLLRGEKDNEK